MAYRKDKGYDDELDYSTALQDPNLSSEDRTRLAGERQAKINDMYGGVEPNYGSTGKTYTQLYGYDGLGGENSKNYDYGTDYHQKALDYAESGDLQRAYDALFGKTNSREAKIAGTGGKDYGITSQEIWESIQKANPGAGDKNALLSMLGELLAKNRNNPMYDYQKGWGEDTYLQLLQQIIGMNYDEWTQSDAYKALADRYAANGTRAMQDTIGQMAARTGGLASSYAGAAASQQYNEYMRQLEDAARALYERERGELVENAGLARDYGDMEYSRYMDELGQRNTDRDYETDILGRLIDYGYQDDEISYEREQATRKEARDSIYYILSNGGSLADLDPEMITASGLTTAELNAYMKEYEDAQAAAAAKGSGSGGSSGGGSGGSSSSSEVEDVVQMMLDDGVTPENADYWLVMHPQYNKNDRTYKAILGEFGRQYEALNGGGDSGTVGSGRKGTDGSLAGQALGSLYEQGKSILGGGNGSGASSEDVLNTALQMGFKSTDPGEILNYVYGELSEDDAMNVAGILANRLPAVNKYLRDMGIIS